MSDWKWVVAPTQANLLRVIEQLSCGLTIEDETGCIIYANERVLEWSQYRVEELEGQPVEILVPDELHERLGTERTRTHAGDQRTRLTAFQRKDGRTFPVAVSPQMFEDDAGERHAIALFVDLGELQTARPMGATEGSLATELANVALKLNSMTFSASLIAAAAAAASTPVPPTPARPLGTRARSADTSDGGFTRFYDCGSTFHFPPHCAQPLESNFPQGKRFVPERTDRMGAGVGERR